MSRISIYTLYKRYQFYNTTSHQIIFDIQSNVATLSNDWLMNKYWIKLRYLSDLTDIQKHSYFIQLNSAFIFKPLLVQMKAIDEWAKIKLAYSSFSNMQYEQSRRINKLNYWFLLNWYFLNKRLKELLITHFLIIYNDFSYFRGDRNNSIDQPVKSRPS